MDENITYDQLPVMSPMMASNSNDGNGGGHGQPIMDDGKFNWYFVTKIVLTYCEKKLF